MALTDLGSAGVLDSLAWAELPFDARMKRLADYYIRRENEVRNAARDYCGPTMGTVKALINSVYRPPYGEGTTTYKAVFKAVKHQKRIRAKRAENPPFKPRMRRPTSEKKRKLDVKNRLHRLGQAHMTLWNCPPKGRRNRTVREDCINVTSISRVGTTVVMLHSDYSDDQIILMIDRTQHVKLAVQIEHDRVLETVTDAIFHIMPNYARAMILNGAVVKLDIVRRGFDIAGKFVPWTVLGVYEEKDLHRLRASWDTVFDDQQIEKG